MSAAELSFQLQAALWGQVYEIQTKRGVLACLIDKKLLTPEHPHLAAWTNVRTLQVQRHLVRALGLIDESMLSIVDARCDHLTRLAAGNGYTVMRAYLQPHMRRIELGLIKVRALWCPLTMPAPSDHGSTDQDARRLALAEAFHRQFDIPGIVDTGICRVGNPAQSDFTLWLSNEGKDDLLHVQEYSYDMPPRMMDFRDQAAHLDELVRHRRMVDSRGVFSRVSAEVTGESFDLSPDIKTHLGALTRKNKPLYKLCQASGYAQSTVAWLQRTGAMQGGCVLRAISITPNGIDSIGSRNTPDALKEPRLLVMERMGDAYRLRAKLKDGDEEGLADQVKAAFRGLELKLPKALRNGMKALKTPAEAGSDFLFEFTEEVPAFANPADTFGIDDAISRVGVAPVADRYFGGSAQAAIGGVMREMAKGGDVISLRDMHAAAIVAGMRRAEAGKLNVIALEGNPGIGKTTAVRRYLEKKPGFLLLYVSPRVIINRDVTQSLARNNGVPTGILTVTTNSNLIASADQWNQAEVRAGRAEQRFVEGAVVADGVVGLVKPEGSILVIDPDQEREIENMQAAARAKKYTLSENEDIVQDKLRVGVLAGIAKSTRELLRLNRGITRTVMTAAIQGYKETAGGRTTMDALSGLFKNPASKPSGIEERHAFALRMPNIVVMVDELAGDGAGALFVHGVARWLHNEFIGCFEEFGQVSPFTVTLVISDASLGNEVVLERYLSAGSPTPDKVLVSNSGGGGPFRVAVTSLRINKRNVLALHVMTNSFPATKLEILYRVSMTKVTPKMTLKGNLERASRAIRNASNEVMLEEAVTQIEEALEAGCVQIIYFAQDKNFLNALKGALAGVEGLTSDSVRVLDGSLAGWKRLELIEPALRDSVRVFLMTSSGARGISFPRTDRIIVCVPRFNIEASLMEIAQLIYRGRGPYKSSDGEIVSGDLVPRKLVMLVNDYVVEQPGHEDPRQWLRRSMDLMSMLVMLRSTIFTRITGDSALHQPLAFVPVGGIGMSEITGLMSQYISEFVSEASVVSVRQRNTDVTNLIKAAGRDVQALFSRVGLRASYGKGTSGRTMVKEDEMRRYNDRFCMPTAPLIGPVDDEPVLADHTYFDGPCIIENWSDFTKQEAFTFEGHQFETEIIRTRLLGLLGLIGRDINIPQSLKVPAAGIATLLHRENEGSVNEFKTIKDVKAGSTWVCLPAGYVEVMQSHQARDVGGFEVAEPERWHDALAGTLRVPRSATMPAIPKFHTFPWAASVGAGNPLRLEVAFDDRYFMASSELNLLNTLLLADVADSE